MTSLYSANAMLIESLLHSAVNRALDLEFFSQKHNFSLDPQNAVSFA